jgi:ABC-2 type transport system permease protein
MNKILTSAAKEILLLRRDRAGLLVLFLMPAILVVVITLVQENVMELTGHTKTRILFLDLDSGELGSSLQHRLATGNLDLIVWDKNTKKASELEAAVTDGEYQVGIILQEGASAGLQRRVARIFEKGTGQKTDDPPLPGVHIFFDPGIMTGLRSGIMAQLQMALQAISVEAEMRTLEEMLNDAMAEAGVPKEFSPLPDSGLADLLGRPLLAVQVGRAPDNRPAEHNPVQQNVPAWALFGLFFTAIPIAGSILQERDSGIWIRLTSMPVSPLCLFSGKILAYIGVCFSQFLLIGLIGAYLFPLIGLPSFTIGANPAGVGIVILFSSLAACGYGICLGLACSTYEQASTIGATSVVAAAAIGGVMVPVYAMPGIMQEISTISPLNWGLTAFHDLLMRGASVTGIADDLGRLTIFFLLTMIFSWKLVKIRL